MFADSLSGSSRNRAQQRFRVKGQAGVVLGFAGSVTSAATPRVCRRNPQVAVDGVGDEAVRGQNLVVETASLL